MKFDPRAPWSLDLKSVALFRIGLGLILLCDLILRWPDLGAHYSDAGILPRAAIQNPPWYLPTLSLHFLSGSVGYQRFIWILNLAAAVCLVVGLRTRAATVTAWVLTSSLQCRNPYLLEQGDGLLRLLLFWSLFLPADSFFSLDRFRRPRPVSEPTTILSWGGVALILQVLFVYLFGVAQKLQGGSDWWSEGSAVSYALRFTPLTTKWAPLLLSHPDLMAGLTRLVLIAEIVFPLLLVCPVFNSASRLCAIAGLSLMHAGFRFFLHLWPFPWINFVSLAVFLPPSTWGGFRTHRTSRSFSSSGSLLAAAAIAVVFFVNLQTVTSRLWEIPIAARRSLYALGLDQNWHMFAPSFEENGWWEAVGRFSDGSETNLMGLLRSQRWRLYLVSLIFGEQRERLFDLGRYLCRTAGTEPSPAGRLESVYIYYVKEKAPLGGPGKNPEKMLLWKEVCPGDG